LYFQLTEQLKRRFILELRRFWSTHPHYSDIVDKIQGKFSFKERPSYGIIVKTSGGNRVDLSADNYMAMTISYVHLARARNNPGVAIEWVREDSVAIQNNGGIFPSLPGVYWIELTEDTEFYVDPLLNIVGEIPTPIDLTTFQLQHAPVAGTVRLYEMPARYMLVEGQNYTLSLGPDGKPNGEIILTTPLTRDRFLVADYRFPAPSRGPFVLNPGYADNKAIPGVILAFGRRNQKGDKLVVIVDEIRRPVALEYGGKWDVTLDFDVIARDVHAQQEIADATVVWIWAVLRSWMSQEGLEITDLSMGGESEETYDEAGDDYFYNSSFSLTVQTDWRLQVPLSAFIRQVTPETSIYARGLASIPDAQLALTQQGIRAATDLGLELVSDPFFSGRIATYEQVR
jgi:hypothetical protein